MALKATLKQDKGCEEAESCQVWIINRSNIETLTAVWPIQVDNPCDKENCFSFFCSFGAGGGISEG